MKVSTLTDCLRIQAVSASLWTTIPWRYNVFIPNQLKPRDLMKKLCHMVIVCMNLGWWVRRLPSIQSQNLFSKRSANSLRPAMAARRGVELPCFSIISFMDSWVFFRPRWGWKMRNRAIANPPCTEKLEKWAKSNQHFLKIIWGGQFEMFLYLHPCQGFARVHNPIIALGFIHSNGHSCLSWCCPFFLQPQKRQMCLRGILKEKKSTRFLIYID